MTDGLFQGNEFFDARDLVQVKYEMLRRVEVEQDAISQAAAAFGFSRPSFYQAQSLRVRKKTRTAARRARVKSNTKATVPIWGGVIPGGRR